MKRGTCNVKFVFSRFTLHVPRIFLPKLFMFRALLILLLIATFSAPQPAPFSDTSATAFNPVDLLQASPIPVLKHEAIEPDIKAKAGLIMDYDTSLILYAKNMDTPLPMASLTKIMTAVLILDHHDPSEVVTVQSNFGTVEGVKISLQKGEKLTVDDLLKALLIPSAGDAAMALAEFHSGTVEKFVAQMNERAHSLNLFHTHFINPIGLDADNHYSSAYDLAVLTKYALHFKEFRNIVKLKSASITSIDSGMVRTLSSTNYLLGSYLDILGVKTGTTDAAGESLINLAQNDGGHRVIAVLLNSPDRFQENKSMIDWAFRSFEW